MSLIEFWKRLTRYPANDQTGNPWPDCVCNDVRYELGHMETCPAYGRSPDVA